jgi:hypothetical protein
MNAEERKAKYPHLVAVQEKLEAEKAEILKVVQPARADYERLSNDPRLLECRRIIKENNKRLAEIDTELGGLARAMGAVSLSSGAGK